MIPGEVNFTPEQMRSARAGKEEQTTDQQTADENVAVQEATDQGTAAGAVTSGIVSGGDTSEQPSAPGLFSPEARAAARKASAEQRKEDQRQYEIAHSIVWQAINGETIGSDQILNLQSVLPNKAVSDGVFRNIANGRAIREVVSRTNIQDFFAQNLRLFQLLRQADPGVNNYSDKLNTYASNIMGKLAEFMDLIRTQTSHLGAYEWLTEFITDVNSLGFAAAVEAHITSMATDEQREPGESGKESGGNVDEEKINVEEQTWRELLDEIKNEYGIDARELPIGEIVVQVEEKLSKVLDNEKVGKLISWFNDKIAEKYDENVWLGLRRRAIRQYHINLANHTREADGSESVQKDVNELAWQDLLDQIEDEYGIDTTNLEDVTLKDALAYRLKGLKDNSKLDPLVRHLEKYRGTEQDSPAVRELRTIALIRQYDNDHPPQS